MREQHEVLGTSLSRRDFVKTSALLGGGALAATQAPWLIGELNGSASREIKPTAEYLLAKAENTIYSVCLNCHTACTFAGKIQNGVLVKLNGNPYSPMNLLPHVPEDTPLAEAATIDAKLCPKGQASVQVLYDPYRIRKVLKRVGPRGNGKWQTIEFNTAIDEIVNGGDLFGEGPVEGLKDIFVLRDPDVSKEMADDVKAIEGGEMTVAEFKSKHAANLDVLIDPDHPDLGPKNNQFVFLAGRIEHGRKELDNRFIKDSFGSVNRYDHTSICEQSHHIAYAEMTRNLVAGTGKDHLKPDIINSEFVIFFGTSPFDASFGPTAMVEKITKGLVERNFKYAVVDPRLSKTAAKAWRWIPVQPGMDAAIALGMTRWIVENERYDATFLENPNLDAANEDGETNSTDATHLVRTDEMVFLTAEDAGLEVPPAAEGEDAEPQFVVMTDAGVALHSQASAGQIEVSTTVNGIPVKSVFTLLKERSQEKTLEEYAELAGVSAADIAELADEFTSHGKKAAAEFYRGPVQHTNGYYAAQALIGLNLLIGNVDHKGGLTAGGGHWHEDGSKDGQPYPLSDIHPGKLTKFGVPINREGKKFDKSTLFDSEGGFPAQRPWYPLTSNVYQEVIPAAGAAYPYPIKAIFLHKGTPVLSCPGGQAQIDIVKDTAKIPLFFVDDVIVGETSMYADYIFPDLTYLERWGTPHTSPDVPTAVSKFRQPTVAPIPEEVEVDGEIMPISMEAVMIAIGKKLGLPGFGAGGFGAGGDFNRPEDWYLKLAANIAFGDKDDGSETLPAAGEEEFAVFRAARAHLPPSVFDEEKWKAAVGEDLWPSVVYLLNHGGRFESADNAYDGDMMKHQAKVTWHLFVERAAKIKDSMTGEEWDGLARVEPVRHSTGAEYAGSGEVALITFKEIFGGHSRTISNYWTNIALQNKGENFVLMNKEFARGLGVDDGDKVKLVSASNPTGVWPIGNGHDRDVVGRVKRIQGMRPGVAAVSWHFGHWAYGSSDLEIDGETIKGDDRRAKGVCPNAAMDLDEAMQTTCLTDPIGGSASFYDTKVRLVKV